MTSRARVSPCALALVVSLAITIGARAARADPGDPSNHTLVLVGIGLAPVDYIFGTALHEGSHALAAELVGAHVEQLHVFPPGVDPRSGAFRFGWTYVTGLSSDPARAAFYIAPKVTDSLLLAGYGVLAYSRDWPRDRYAGLGLTVVATGLWVDFTKDIVLFGSLNDVEQFFAVTGIGGWRGELAARSAYAALVVGGGALLVRGYQRTFATASDPTQIATRAAGERSALVVPLVYAPF